MSAELNSKSISGSKRAISIALSTLLALAGLVAVPSSAYASTAANPTIVFDGNILATAVPSPESSTRISSDSLRVSTESLSRTVATTRNGYTFGGWSLTRGGAATEEITTATTADSTRTIFAVWNTFINYDGNGVEGGALPGEKTRDVYRFGDTLTLATQGTLVKSGFAFGGWMRSTLSTTRLTSFQAANTDNGNLTLYAAWIKTVSFNGTTATSGTIPVARVFTFGGAPLKLPVVSEMTLRKAGHDFVGWSLTSNGPVIANSGSYVPLVAQQTLYAIWKVQGTKATTRVFFKPDKSTLRAAQKLELRELVDTLRGRTSIRISLAATRSRGDVASLGKARNRAVVAYLRSLGVQATFTRTSTIGTSSVSSSLKNNRVTISASWTNPTS
jgi:uncharacterized repeat protein (TIGR02543 family)